MAHNNGDSEEKKSLSSLARKLGQLSAEKKRAALEVSAALAGVSLRVSREFVEAVPKAARILSADDLRNWGELGRRLAMGNADVGAKFFADGVAGLKNIPDTARSAVFQVCTRQLVLSSSISLETFQLIPDLAKKVGDDKLLTDILLLAVEIAQRSAKHSSEFLQNTPDVAAALAKFEESKDDVSPAILALAAQFAERTGGMTADLWANLPAALEKITAADAVLLMKRSGEFLEFGGSVTLHCITAGSEVMASSL